MPIAFRCSCGRSLRVKDELAGHNLFAEATRDVVAAIVEGAAELAAGEFAPLNQAGDEEEKEAGESPDEEETRKEKKKIIPFL